MFPVQRFFFSVDSYCCVNRLQKSVEKYAARPHPQNETNPNLHNHLQLRAARSSMQLSPDLELFHFPKTTAYLLDAASKMLYKSIYECIRKMFVKIKKKKGKCITFSVLLSFLACFVFKLQECLHSCLYSCKSAPPVCELCNRWMITFCLCACT